MHIYLPTLLSGIASVSDFTACFTQLHKIAVWTFNNARLLTNYYLWPYDCLMISLWCYCMFHTLHTLGPSTAHYNSPSPPLRHTSSLTLASSIFIPFGKQNTFSVIKWCGQEKLKGLVPSLSGCCGGPSAKNFVSHTCKTNISMAVQDAKISKRVIDQVFIDKPFK